jgi:hypothetical protein
VKDVKNNYLTPEIDILLFESADIITTSGVEGTPDGSWDVND